MSTSLCYSFRKYNLQLLQHGIKYKNSFFWQERDTSWRWLVSYYSFILCFRGRNFDYDIINNIARLNDKTAENPAVAKSTPSFCRNRLAKFICQALFEELETSFIIKKPNNSGLETLDASIVSILNCFKMKTRQNMKFALLRKLTEFNDVKILYLKQ